MSQQHLPSSVYSSGSESQEPPKHPDPAPDPLDLSAELELGTVSSPPGGIASVLPLTRGPEPDTSISRGAVSRSTAGPTRSASTERTNYPAPHDDSRDWVAEQLRAGKTPVVGQHRVLGVLGQGGMGNVYRAVDLNLRREVALKVIAKRLAQHREMRFVLEAQVTGLLEHPGIVPVHAMGHTPDGRPWYTMKLITGQTLADWLYEDTPDGSLRARRADRPSLERMLRVLIRVCEALGYAHSRGVIHRDIKPTNIMIGEFGEVLVLDWGLAKVLATSPLREYARTITQSQSHDAFSPEDQFAGSLPQAIPSTASLLDSNQYITQEGRVCGTAEYMPPEQAAGLVDRIDGRADVYALGVILHEMLSGARPVQASRRSSGPLTPPERISPTWVIPPELSDICCRALAYDPRERIPDASILAQELEGFLAGRPAWRNALPPINRRSELSPWTSLIGQWHTADNQIAPVQPHCTDGTPIPQVLLHNARITGDIRIEAIARIAPEAVGEFTILLAIPDANARPARVLNSGYQLTLGADWNSRNRLRRAGVDVQLEPNFRIVANKDYRITAEHSAGRIRLWVDDHLLFDYEDRFPLRGDRFGFLCTGAGTQWKDLHVYTRGMPLAVSVLAIPDLFYSSNRADEAREWYTKIADDHANRPEGRMAAFKAGLCALQAGDSDQADYHWSNLAVSPDSALMWIGWATANRNDPLEELRLILDGMLSLYGQPGAEQLAQYAVERAIAATQHRGVGLTLPFYLAAAEAESPIRPLALEHVYSYLADGVWPGAADVHARLETLGQLSAVADRFVYTRPWLEAILTRMEIDTHLIHAARERLINLVNYDACGLASWRRLLKADWNADAGHLPTAQAGFEQLTREAITPRVHYTAWNRLGRLHHANRRFDEALACFRRVIAAPASEHNHIAKRYAWNTTLGILIAQRQFPQAVELARQFSGPRVGISLTLSPLIALRGAYALWHTADQKAALRLIEAVRTCSWKELATAATLLAEVLQGAVPTTDQLHNALTAIPSTIAGCIAFLIADHLDLTSHNAASHYRLAGELLGDSIDAAEIRARLA